MILMEMTEEVYQALSSDKQEEIDNQKSTIRQQQRKERDGRNSIKGKNERSNPQDFALTNFKCKQSSEIEKHNYMLYTAGDQKWKCYACGMISCTKFSTKHIMKPKLLQVI